MTKSVLLMIERKNSSFQVLEAIHMHFDGFLLYPARCEAMSDTCHVSVFIEESHKNPAEERRLLRRQNLLNLSDFNVVLKVDVEV